MKNDDETDMAAQPTLQGAGRTNRMPKDVYEQRPGRINRLPKDVYDLIAAGEVITSPVSVVKELVENSIDAGADRVSVSVAQGGMASIRVGDNGAGIHADDLELAFTAHSTSKLRTADDLYAVSSLGFRGEALPSIAAVSEVRMITAGKTDGQGREILIRGGEVLKNIPAGTPGGTDVMVRELFYNIPARKKHMSGARSEVRKITDYVSRMAIRYPGIAFKYEVDGTVLFSTRGGGDQLSAIMTVFGTSLRSVVLPVSGEFFKGYISGANGLRGRRSHQIFFVNGRLINNKALTVALEDGYAEFLEKGKYPQAIIEITADPSEIDINIHPSKDDVRFLDPAKFLNDITENVRNTLISKTSIPSVKGWKNKRDTAFDFAENPAGGGEGMGHATYEDEGQYFSLPTDRGETGDGEAFGVVDLNEFLSAPGGQDPPSRPYAAPSGTGSAEPDKTFDIASAVGVAEQEQLEYSREAGHTAFPDAPDTGSFLIDRLEVKAVLFATYLLAANGEEVYIIDQHAAHERVNYERLMAQLEAREPSAQALLIPYTFTPSAMALDSIEGNMDLLAELGYEISEFGTGTFAVHAIPADMDQGEAVSILHEIVDGGARHADVIKDRKAVERLIMRACKSSVKANDLLPAEAYESLLEQLAKCRNPYTCPHGRPVFLKLSKSALESLFKRA
ncbi:MAG: DNA mismatch repair endonuclease MutL [Clostridiales Family XIII bacterium]|jgi:DNA mismatch repair protein MutL|nr:DNA mismatch repair endonuclease MutL [Clostridiales Family XIII bacterium]